VASSSPAPFVTSLRKSVLSPVNFSAATGGDGGKTVGAFMKCIPREIP
jgi:hypothetical protein